MSAPPSIDGSPDLQAFREGMKSLGYVEGAEFVIEPRFANADRGSLQRLTKELLDARVDMIVTVGTPTTAEAKLATSSIPIVMTGAESPIEHGLIASFAHPGANVTGLTQQPNGGFWKKGLELLKEASPGIRRVGILGADHPHSISSVDGMSVKTYGLQVQNLDELKSAFNDIRSDNIDAMFIFPAFVVTKYVAEISDFLEVEHLPAISQDKPMMEHGALLYYNTDFLALRRRAALYVDKIMNGAKPDELPVEQPSKFEFIVNMKRARALGLALPTSIMAFADQIIE